MALAINLNSVALNVARAVGPATFILVIGFLPGFNGVGVSFLGARGRHEARLVPEAGYEIDLLDLTGIDRRNPLRAARAAFQAADDVHRIG